jgi:hypothetical protein
MAVFGGVVVGNVIGSSPSSAKRAVARSQVPAKFRWKRGEAVKLCGAEPGNGLIFVPRVPEKNSVPSSGGRRNFADG